jgi:hypothetical protein
VDGPLDLLPSEQRTPTRRVLDRVGQTLWGSLVGQFLDMLVLGVVCGVGVAYSATVSGLYAAIAGTPLLWVVVLARLLSPSGWASASSG